MKIVINGVEAEVGGVSNEEFQEFSTRVDEEIAQLNSTIEQYHGISGDVNFCQLYGIPTEGVSTVKVTFSSPLGEVDFNKFSVTYTLQDVIEQLDMMWSSSGGTSKYDNSGAIILDYEDYDSDVGDWVPMPPATVQVFHNNQEYLPDPSRLSSIDIGVATFNGRSGDVIPQTGDYTAEMVGAATMAQVNTTINNTVGNINSILDAINGEVV